MKRALSPPSCVRAQLSLRRGNVCPFTFIYIAHLIYIWGKNVEYCRTRITWLVKSVNQAPTQSQPIKRFPAALSIWCAVNRLGCDDDDGMSASFIEKVGQI